MGVADKDGDQADLGELGLLLWVRVNGLTSDCCRGRKHRKMEEAEASPMQEKKPVPSETY